MPALVALAFVLATFGCSARGQAPVELSELNGRSVLEPARLGVLSSNGEMAGLPSSVMLGNQAAGRVVVYLEFPEPEASRRLLRAQLLLTVGDGSQTVRAEVSRAAPAGERLAAWSDQPRSVYPRVSVELGTTTGVQRIDVTEIVNARSKPGEAIRLILRAEPADGDGLLIVTGAAGGESPRLELYWE